MIVISSDSNIYKIYLYFFILCNTLNLLTEVPSSNNYINKLKSSDFPSDVIADNE